MKTQSIVPTKGSLADTNGIFEADYLEEGNLLNQLPVGICVCDQTGIIQKYNEQAVKLWGRKPGNDDRYCGSLHLFSLDGKNLPHNATPIALSLKEGICGKDEELIIERPDKSRIIVKVNTAPIKNNQGVIVGAVNCFQDITAQKQVEKELERNRFELQDYVENAAIALHWVNADGRIIWANEAELNMLGYSKEEYVGHLIAEFHVHTHVIKGILDRLYKNETLSQHEAVLRCKDGSEKTVLISSNVLWEDGKFMHTRCFTVDITKQQKLLQILKDSEDHYIELVKGLPCAVYTTDIAGRILLYNEAAVELWGRTPVIGKDLWCGSWKIYTTDEQALPLENCPMAVTLKEKRPILGEELIVERPDGTRSNIVPHPRPLYDASGEVIGAVNMLIDITKIRNSENSLRETEQNLRVLATTLEEKVEKRTTDLKTKNEELQSSEEKYHKMIEEVEDYAILLLDTNGIIQNWNRGAERIKGYKESEIVGKHFSNFYLQEDRERGLPEKLLNQARTTGKALHEGWRRRKDGTAFWGNLVITALHDADNNITGFSKVTRDLTERKIAEDKIREYAAEMEFKNKELEQFAYAAAHDMKEPLRKIQLYNNYILESSGLQLQGREKTYMERSIHAATRMQRLIEDLLTYSKTSSIAQQYEPVDLNKIIAEAIQLHSHTIEETKARVEVQDLPVIQGIPFQCRQLFDNLLSNSLKYRHKDRHPHIKVTAEWINGYEVSENQNNLEGKFYKISVTDNGIGFDADDSDKIFDLFQRLHAREDYSGTGIGLAICKKIAQNHKGFILASGEQDKGATFIVLFPA